MKQFGKKSTMFFPSEGKKKRITKKNDADTKLLLHGTNPNDYPWSAYSAIRAFGEFAKSLIKCRLIDGDKWHTVEFYMRKDGDGVLLDSIRVSNTIRKR